MNIRIVTQNVMCWDAKGGEYEARRSRMKRLFDRLSPDIIGIQEATSRWKRYFADDLVGYGSVFFYRGAIDHEGTPIYYRKDRFDLEESGRFWLSETPERESYGPGAGCLRIAVWGIFRERSSGVRFLFVNTHLDNRSEKARVLGAELVADFIRRRGEGLAAFVTGDFNDVAYSEALDKLCGELADSRLCAKETSEDNTHSSRYGSPADCSIDYVLLKDADAIGYSVERELDGRFAQSDHYAVCVDVKTRDDAAAV